MQIDRRLNIVIPVERERARSVAKGANGRPEPGPEKETYEAFYIHAAPISRDTFRSFYKPLARTYAEMMGGGYGATAGPSIAKMLLLDTAHDLGVRNGASGVSEVLIPEIRRLANVIVPGKPSVPLDGAGDLLTEDEREEIENILVFFTLVSVVPAKRDTPTMLGIISAMWRTENTSLNSTEYANSLQTSTETGNSGEKQSATARPDQGGVANATVDGRPSLIPS